MEVALCYKLLTVLLLLLLLFKPLVLLSSTVSFSFPLFFKQMLTLINKLCLRFEHISIEACDC